MEKNTTSSCIFCDIVQGSITSYKIGENEHAIAFLDAFPVADGHTLVIPKKHAVDFSSTDQKELQAVSLLAKQIALKLKMTLKPSGLNYVSNEGAIAGQVVFHFHLHIVPKYETGKGFGYNVNKTNKRSLEENYQLISESKN
ncbi:HIT family protein [Mycoplasmoides genitalium]|uniref:Uncharacterized HIT-like protein MG132 n=2 Tax=Mycoplasmoides genitalium TaxID=2097 RepID=YHIT_MYCGE|nr:HIT family protein [Mycoplasmoides genitalium]P47378.1 RecName: Full=Uncharacterized HIT-like protein MG132 [Mycoplasmoides genitalium G37]ABY79510.1 HIT domain protein [synthetic Mycoplasma genitalium JCVI-1.0]AAC71349.1 HIT domain protein [Mycoplasmoides genitalium G37]AFQ02950.1 HIT domain-containing protein [Mycoplasmoides genitalium M2321]AFQ03940.1 HIT domain-containing protein [Mycoplasmoides genitalium M6320]